MKCICDWYSIIETYWEWETRDIVTKSERQERLWPRVRRSLSRVRVGRQEIEKWTMKEWEIKQSESERQEMDYESESHNYKNVVSSFL